MRTLCTLLGNSLLLLGLGGLALLIWGEAPGAPTPSTSALAEVAAGRLALSEAVAPRVSTFTPTGGSAETPSAAADRDDPPPADAAETDGSPRPITAVAAPSIGLEAEVAPSALVERDGGLTWEVPPFRAGHAQHTAGAGQVGNAVLFGHVSSRRDGDVFRHLDRVRVGDLVHVHSGPVRFDYRVVEVRSVERSDASVLEPGRTATLSLITCSGLWLPTIWDYTHRLVVRAELDTAGSLDGA